MGGGGRERNNVSPKIGTICCRDGKKIREKLRRGEREREREVQITREKGREGEMTREGDRGSEIMKERGGDGEMKERERDRQTERGVYVCE